MDRLSTKGQMIDQIDLRAVPHSGFDRSNHNFGTGKLGNIIPVRLDEVYPGDRIQGRPEIVVNFEPLAAPIMGSMVVKQESFFVPHIQLWRNAYKFFTGKNGFNDEMPSISPQEIFNIYNTALHSFVFTNISSADLQDVSQDFNSLVYVLRQMHNDHSKKYSDIAEVSLITHFGGIVDVLKGQFERIYEPKKMLDLVQPCLDIFERFRDSEELKLYSSKFDSSYSDSDIFTFGSLIGSLITDYFNFFHGPSSLFDYLGWPVPLDLNYYEYGDKVVIPQYGIYNIFQYGVYRSIVGGPAFNWTGHVENKTTVSDFFSRVPLAFSPFKAYYLVWYWNYRDQLLETDILDPEDDLFLDGIDPAVVLYCTMMRQRCWYKDTFTTALTNTGDGNLIVPTLSAQFNDKEITYYDGNGQLINSTDQQSAYEAGATVCKINNGDYEYSIPMNYLRGAFSVPYGDDASFDSDYISLDLFDRIKRLRSVVQKRLILGYEVDDVVYSSFMVKMSNVRIHIPELLGRGRDQVIVNTIVNNTSTDLQIAGDKTATAYAHGQQSEMNYFSEDWGYFLTFTTIMPIQSYAGGLPRLYLKKDPLDYMWPEYATMGMDAVYNTELAALGSKLTDEQGLQVFGYQGRYYDLKSRQDEEHGRLLTDLNYLTFSREWDKINPPKLNYIFVHCWPRLDGFVIESPLVDLFRYDCYNAHAWERRLPVPSEYVGA